MSWYPFNSFYLCFSLLVCRQYLFRKGHLLQLGNLREVTMALVQTRLFTVPHFPVGIEHFTLWAAILDECQIYLEVSGQFGRKGEKIELFSLPPFPHRIKPDAHPLGTYETKMAACTNKLLILTILQENRRL